MEIPHRRRITMIVQNGKLADYAEYLEPFFNAISDCAFYMLDASGHVLSWNVGAERLMGYTTQEIIGCHFSEFYTTDDVAADKPQCALTTSTQEGVYHEESVVVRKDRSRFWATVTITALRDKAGELQGFATLARDITERKTNETMLRVSAAKYRALYENSYDAILLTNPEKGALLAANPAACKLFGYSEQELTSMRREQVLDMTSPKVAAAFAQRAVFRKDAAELTFIRKDGMRFEARVSSKLFMDEHGQQLSSTNIQDISDIKKTEEALRHSEERFRLLFENAPLGIVQLDQNGHVTSTNKKIAELSGYSSEEAVGLTHIDVALPEDRAMGRKVMDEILFGKSEIVNHERPLLRKDGSTIWVRITAKMMRDKSGKPEWGIVIFEDITDRKQTEDALRQSEEKFRATFEHAPLGIAELTVDGRFFEANSKLADILGFSREEITHMTIMDVTHPGDMEKSLSRLEKIATGKANTYVAEKRYLRKDRSYVWVNVTASLAPIYNKPQFMVVTIEDITARKIAEEELRRAIESSYHQANHDMLTGLANRASFNNHLKETLSYAKRDGHLVAIHMLDLDGFKSVNDTLGHHIGDLLLKEVANRIKSNVRATDVAARLGGDEFVVIQTHLAEPTAAGILAGKLVKDLGRQYALEDQQVHSGASIGVALYPNDAEDPKELLKQADLALYDAKHRGRYNYQFYRQELSAAMRKAQRMEQELECALRENQFFLHYQPQFDLKSGKITGIEALLRWRHPAKGNLEAAAFIKDAERARLMPAIGEWVLQTACQQYKKWSDAGLAVPLTLCLSPMQLRDPCLLQTLKRILEESELPPPLLQLEMRESMLWNLKFSNSPLKQMKESGLRLALSDFGSEMTALSTLARFPLDAVKPSQALVKKLPSRTHEATILSAIIGVAHDLNITVCADGVETANQLAAVKEQGCDAAQGYFLSSPLDSTEMKRLIEVQLAH
jgi:diguanylate cyclase (GGDEF)-like protein/PAS domain S-box-containing protein